MWIYETTELYHHGIKGQKWGEKNGPPYPLDKSQMSAAEKKKIPKYGGKGIKGPLSSSKDPDAWRAFEKGDYIIKKGSIYERATTDPNEKFKNRMYVSENGSQYINELIDYGIGFVDVYELDRDVLIAGRDTIVDILRSLDTKKSNKIADRLSKNRSNDWLANPLDDFMMSKIIYKKTANDFINELKNRGYDGIPDPLDSGFKDSFSFDATIFINDVLTKIDQRVDEGFEPIKISDLIKAFKSGKIEISKNGDIGIEF